MLRSLWCLDAVSLTVRRSQCDDHIGGSPTTWGAQRVAQDFKVVYPPRVCLRTLSGFSLTARLCGCERTAGGSLCGIKGNAVGAPEWRAKPRLPPQL